MIQNVRYLQWQHAQETTNGLLKTRAITLERYTYYLRLLGQAPDQATVAADLHPGPARADRGELRRHLQRARRRVRPGRSPPWPTTRLQPAQGTSPSTQSGATGQGQLYLNKNEDAELNTHLPTARDYAAGGEYQPTPLPPRVYPDSQRGSASGLLGDGRPLAGCLTGKPWPVSPRSPPTSAEVIAGWQQDQAGIAARTAGYQRRADEWTLQANLAARELAQIGRQIIASLIAEQIAYHDYQTVKTQVQQAQDVQAFLQGKFTSAGFYSWMQSDLSAPVLPVLPVRLRHGPQGRADDEAGADAARSWTRPSSSSSTTGTPATRGCCPARRCISTSSGWSWPTTTTTSGSSS